MASGVGFEPGVKPVPLSVRICDFLVSNGASSLRDVYQALAEEPNRVDESLRRLWRTGLILRTREPTFKFETESKGRAGVSAFTRAINLYRQDS